MLNLMWADSWNLARSPQCGDSANQASSISYSWYLDTGPPSGEEIREQSVSTKDL